MSTPKNTPTPWHVGMKPGPMIYGPYGEQIADMREPMVLDEENRANIALIVRAVNAHEQMVGALESVAQAFAVEHIAEVIPPSVMAKVKAALRAARGEK